VCVARGFVTGLAGLAVCVARGFVARRFARLATGRLITWGFVARGFARPITRRLIARWFVARMLIAGRFRIARFADAGLAWFFGFLFGFVLSGNGKLQRHKDCGDDAVLKVFHRGAEY
jgi:hypothetical protein